MCFHRICGKRQSKGNKRARKYVKERGAALGRLINIGYGNMVNFDKIVSVVSPESAPIKRMVQTAKDKGTAIDATQGRKTQGVIITDCDYIILSALLPETIAGRCRGREEVDSL
ncbi:MAG: DUF370 domain-containing protein [Lachnospiraceae bacterium]|nr:DUF370 domain-containing protein [Lachnospiraceae bacterium]